MKSGSSTITVEEHYGVHVVRFDDGVAHWAGVLASEPLAIVDKTESHELVPYMKPISKHTITDLCALAESEASAWNIPDQAQDELASCTATTLVHPPHNLTTKERGMMSACGWKRTKRRPFKGVREDVWMKVLGTGEPHAAFAARHIFDLHRWKVAILCIATDGEETIVSDED